MLDALRSIEKGDIRVLRSRSAYHILSTALSVYSPKGAMSSPTGACSTMRASHREGQQNDLDTLLHTRSPHLRHSRGYVEDPVRHRSCHAHFLALDNDVQTSPILSTAARKERRSVLTFMTCHSWRRKAHFIIRLPPVLPRHCLESFACNITDHICCRC
jgi:hypothetical protein